MSDLDFLHQYVAGWPEVPGEVFERATDRLPRSFPTRASTTIPRDLPTDVQLRVGARSVPWRHRVVSTTTSPEVIDTLVGDTPRAPVRLAAAANRHLAPHTAVRLAAFAAQRQETALLRMLVDNTAVPPSVFSDPYVLEVLRRLDVQPPPTFFDADRLRAATTAGNAFHRSAALFALCHPDGPEIGPDERRELLDALLAAGRIDPADVMLRCVHPLSEHRWAAPVDVPVDVAEHTADLLAAALATRPAFDELSPTPRLRCRGGAAVAVLRAAERLEPEQVATLGAAVDLDAATAAELAAHGGPVATAAATRWVLCHVDTVDDDGLVDWAVQRFVATAPDPDTGDPDSAALALLTHRALDDDTVLRVLRRSRRRLMTRWMLGLCPANQPHRTLVEALAAEPGLSTSGVGGDVAPPPLGPGAAAGSYPMGPLDTSPAWGFLHLAGVFDDVDGSFVVQVREETARRFCDELRRSVGDRTELWSLAFEMVTGDHPVSPSAALDMVAAAASDPST